MSDENYSKLGKVPNYTGNSHKSKAKAEKEMPEEKEKLKPIVEGKVIRRKKGLGRKLADVFAGDDAQNVGSYILWDVLIPALKSMIYEAGSQGLERSLFGEVRSRSSRERRPGYTSYNKMYDRRERDDRDRHELSSRGRRTHDFGEIILESRSEAEDILDELSNRIDQYDVATVSDLYELLDLDASFQDERWGWTDMRGARALRVRNGYRLDLPKTEPID